MYLAPLNYDRFFKKVFSDLDIAKKFLEDALTVSITEISVLPIKNKITDASRSVEFDFRCKISDTYVIIEMQQWYKPDIIQRFHLYHCLNTALQLEELPKKLILTIENDLQEVKDYSKLQPVFTIIWLVHENLSETDDYLSLVPTNESVLNFIRNNSLWKRHNIKELQEERKKILKKINNNTKGLLWMQDNKEIFFFQKNIVKNRINASYLQWFDFAEKTLKRTNSEKDFAEYEQDEIFRKMIKRLKLSASNKEDLSYIDDYEKRQAKVQLFIDSISKEAVKDKQMELDNERVLKEEAQLREEEERRQKEVALQKIEKTIIKLHKKGFSVEEIAEDLELLVAEVKKVLEKI